MHHCFLAGLAILSFSACWAQTAPSPAIVGAGYKNPFPIIAAPGQLVTLYVQAPAESSISAVYWNQQSLEPAPVLQVSPSGTACIAPPNSPCGTFLAVTVQIPLDAPASVIVAAPTSLAVSVNRVQSAYVGVPTQPDRIHILNACDSMIQTGPGCAPLILHSKGRPVSVNTPAVAGEELVAYATGLGQTNPPLTTGQAATEIAPTIAQFNLDFNYRPNALATQPNNVYPPSNPPLFAGATGGFVGLYQINFIVPPAPAGLQPCSPPVLADGPIGGLVFSNLTVSVGSLVSFDGAGICVTPGS